MRNSNLISFVMPSIAENEMTKQLPSWDMVMLGDAFFMASLTGSVNPVKCIWIAWCKLRDDKINKR
jgi:hypothetical protein